MSSLSLLLMIILSINSLLLLSLQVVNSQSLNHDQQDEQRILLKLKNEWGNPPSLDVSWAPWNPSTLPNHCNWTGIMCDMNDGLVTALELVNLNSAEKIPKSICVLKHLTVISLYSNSLHGEFPTFLYNCSKLEILDLSYNDFQGRIPDDIDRLSSLRYLLLGNNMFSGVIPASIGRFPFLQRLELHYNRFNGSFPPEIGNLTNLEFLSLGFNLFSPSRIPQEFGKLKKLSELSMNETNLIGEIPETVLADMMNLEKLDLSNNNLKGTIPRNLFLLKNLTHVYLSNNKISGDIPSNIESLKLRVIDLSTNMLTGKIPEGVTKLEYLEVLHMYSNRLTGEIPAAIDRIPYLTDIQLSNNSLTGVLPPELGLHSELGSLKVSSNQLTGNLPEYLCARSLLIEIVVSANNLSGGLPSTFENCTELMTIELQNNKFSGEIPAGIWSTNLRVFNASNNFFTGKLNVELTLLSPLRSLALDGNQLSGEIPSNITYFRSLVTLTLSRNQISGQLPPEISLLSDLKILDLSQNQISGEPPSEIVNLRLSFLNLSSNKLTGKLPAELDNPAYERSFLNNSGLCANNQIPYLKFCIAEPSRKSSRFSRKQLAVIVVLGGATFLVSIILILFVLKVFCKRKPEEELDTWDMRSFQELHFTESNILSNLTENNQIGSGGSGKVYRVPIAHLGHFVAVKMIWSERKLDQSMEKQFQAEVQILGTIRHTNIVKLLCCISNKVSRLLVYEYMENGSLYEWLHQSNYGLSTSNNGRFLDWPKRLKIAVEVAQGLSYMHHNCSPPIIHRDVKTSNILLDSDFKARIADFGLARTLIRQGEPNSASVIAGSFGYIAPEYAHTKKVNEKIDVYSFGVVLLELVTGKEAKKGDEYRNLAEWAWSRFQELKSMDAQMDEDVKEECYLEEMRMVFKLGMICTHTLPSSRPSMKDALQILLWHAPPHQALSTSSPGIQRVEE